MLNESEIIFAKIMAKNEKVHIINGCLHREHKLAIEVIAETMYNPHVLLKSLLGKNVSFENEFFYVKSITRLKLVNMYRLYLERL